MEPNKRTGADQNHRGAVHAVAVGTLQDLLASALTLPLGVVAAALLSRSLGPDGYGVLTVAVSLVLWIEVSITLGFSRTTIKLIAGTVTWSPMASALINAQFLASTLVAGLLAVLAMPISALLNSPELAPHLRLLALDIPLFAVASIHSSILVGRDQFSRRAILTAIHSGSRLILIVISVSLGFSIQGAIGAYIGGSAIFLICSRIFVHPPVSLRTGFSLAGLWDYALPLLIFTIVMNLFQRLDLFLVKALWPVTEAAGHYGAAQNIAGVLGLIAAAFTPLLLATLTRVARQGNLEQAKTISEQSFRLIICLLPLVGVAAASSEEIMNFVYGRPFAPGAPVLALLLLTGLGRLLIAVASSALTAANRPDLVAKLILPAIPMAIILNMLLIPRFGTVAAALVTTVLTWGAVLSFLVAVSRIWQIRVSGTSFLRCVAVALFVFVTTTYFSDRGLWLFVTLPFGIALSLIGLACVGEFRYAEFLGWIALFRRPIAVSEDPESKT